jgi:AcrR family transcriptional regulator
MRLVDDAVLDATEAILSESGFDGVSLERVAERAQRSRVTLWRQGVTKETLITGLLQRLTDDFQQEFWPVLNGSGSGRDRLSASLEALFEIADRHLDLLAVSDQVFHWAAQRCDFPGGAQGFMGPFVGSLRQGSEDGTLTLQGEPRTPPTSCSTPRAGATCIFVIGIGGRANALVRRSWPS